VVAIPSRLTSAGNRLFPLTFHFGQVLFRRGPLREVSRELRMNCSAMRKVPSDLPILLCNIKVSSRAAGSEPAQYMQDPERPDHAHESLPSRGRRPR